MRRVDLALPEFGFVVATRAALGAGLGLLATLGLGRQTRQRIGATLLTVGALTTIPALFLIFGREPFRRSSGARRPVPPEPLSRRGEALGLDEVASREIPQPLAKKGSHAEAIGVSPGHPDAGA
jgi:hypothetical protein